MVIQRIAILVLLITQVLSAPSGCIESCGFYTKQFQTGSQTPGNIQGYNGLTQTATRLQGLDYSRPGTWSEHNDYNTDNGNGKVHEEHGQIVDGPKTVRYYKKNYSSSYSTGNTYGAGLPEIEHQNNYGHGIRVSNTGESFNSQQAYNQIGNIESSAQQREYNRIQSQQHTQSSVRRANTQSERLEDFGEYGGSSQGVQDASDLTTQISQKTYSNGQPRNWSKVDSYGTDGGHGQVFEEEGQYVSGPKKVRYYKRNYTSSSGLTSSIPISEVTNTGVENINREIEKFHREIGKEFNQISSTRNTASSNIAQTNIGMHELASDNRYSNTHRSQIDHGSSLSTHHNNEQHLTDTASKPYINPSQNTYGANSFSMYERHEGYVSKLQPSTQFINPTPGYTNVLSTGNSGYNRNTYSKGIMQQQTDNMQETQLLDSHQSRFNRDQITDDDMRQNIYSQNRHINSGMPGRVSHYKEHWSSSHTKEASVPQYSPDISHTNEQGALYNNRYRENSFNSAHQTTLEKLRTGEFELSQMGNHADCAQGTTNHAHTDSQLHRKYKRSTNSNPYSYMQQSDEFDDLTQRTSRKPKLVQESQQLHYPWRPSMNTQQSEDLTQQTGEFDDLTQQTSGKLQFGPESQDSYQPRRPSTGNQETEDWTQQTGEFDDLTQQTSGKLEFGPQSQDSYQPRRPSTGNQETEDWTQQTGEFDDLTQQTSGKLEFGPSSRDSYQPRRPSTGNQQTEDLTQQTGEFDDLTQQTSGKLEFGPPSRDSYQPRRPSTNTQQTEDLTQQTGEFDDLTQQTSGKLEFGPSSRDSYLPRRPSTNTQQTEDLTQQTGEFDDLTQQTSEKLEFGQQSMKHNPYFLNSDRSRESVNMQNSEFNTQSNENFPVVGVNGNIPVEQQVSSAPLPKPAGKPKPRSRYSRIGALSNIQNMHNSDNQQPSHPDANIYELPPNVVTEIDVNKVRDKNIRGDQNANNFMDTSTSKHLNQAAADKTHSIEEAYVDSVNSLHKSNDATVGLQWHYTYHPSDQRQFIQQTDQRDKGHLQQQSSSLESQQSDHSFDQQETQNIYQQSSIFDNEESEISQKYQDKSDNIKKQSELEFSQQTASEIDNEQHVQSSETKLQLEPRIIEVYGGGPYDASHNDDIYSGITVNPSATLLPINNVDPWDIHEKPREMIGIVNEVTSTPMSVIPLNENHETTHAPSFWSKLGSQITTTFGKAKEKAKNIFG
ncbi:uncharacterized protein LOC143348043 isoform X2 [Colletes latitarsis]|uniref:uncharacterized protein LOC143348043 isoform X2 n=1 Tax=Colletes latitarsis TaxID=2605962 RepID=UPI004036C893